MEAFTTDSVVPDVLDEIPATCLQLKFEGTILSPGGILTPTQAKDQPCVEYQAATEDLHTLVLIDPDAPTRTNPKVAEVLHWLIVNIPGNDVKAGQELVEYIGPGAPKGTGLHRYVFLVYKQSKGKMVPGFEKIPNTTTEGRKSFKIRDFAKKHGLHVVAGNFFQAEYDEYVPILQQQVGSAKTPSK